MKREEAQLPTTSSSTLEKKSEYLMGHSSQQRQALMDLSVCIVNTSNIRYLKPCLESIFRHTRGLSFEVIVVDKNSTDNSVDIVQSEFPQVRLITGDIRKGYTPNMNLGLKVATGLYVLILNDDTLLKSNVFAEMVHFLEQHPEYGAVGPRLLNADGSFQIGPRGSLSLKALICQELMLDVLFPQSPFFSGFAMTYWNPEQPCDMRTGSGACLMVRREVLDRVGLLEENIPFGADDAEFSDRIRRHGWKLYYLAGSTLVHYGGVSLSRIQAEATIRYYQGWFWWLKHRYGRIQAKCFRLFAAFGALMRIAFWILVYVGNPKRRPAALSRIQGRWGVLRVSLFAMGPRHFAY